MYSREKAFARNEQFKTRNRHKNTPSFSSILLDEMYRSIDGDSNLSDTITSKTRSHYKNNGSVVSRHRRHSLIPESGNDLLLLFKQSSGDRSSSDAEMFGYDKTRSSVASPKHGSLSDEEDLIRNHQSNKSESIGSIKSKSSASKIYSQLKKLKQPISPGGRLTSFIHSLFNSDHQSKKKSKNKVDSIKGFQDSKSNDKAKSSAASSLTSCSSNASFSGNKVGKRVQRTARCDSASVVLDQDLRQSAIRKREDCDRYMRKPPLPPNFLRGNQCNHYHNYKYEDVDHDEDEHDGFSDSSSDLFELDHLAFYGTNIFEDLPVYETTRFDANRLVRVA